MAGMKDDGVSSVVSAVLVFALFSTAFVLWTVQSLPEWIEEREHAHATGVAERFADAAIAMVNDDEAGNGASFTVPLAPDPVPLVQQTPASATIASEPGSRLWFNLTGETVHMEGGRMLGIADAPSGGVGAGSSATIATEVASIDALQLRLASDGEGEATLGVDDGTASVQATLRRTDAATNCAGRGALLELVTSTSTRQSVLLCDTDVDVDYTVDLMDAPLPFRAAVARLETPLTITLSAADLDAGAGNAGDTGYVSMVWQDEEGTIGVIGAGTGGDADVAVAGGALRFRPNFFEFNERDIILDASGVLNAEADGAAFATAPPFRFAGTPAAPSLDWTVFDLAATGSLSGRSGATVRVDTTSVDTRVMATGSSAIIEVEGEAAPAWRAHWQAEAILSGFESIVTVEGQGSSARLVLDPTAPWVVRVAVVEAMVEVM